MSTRSLRNKKKKLWETDPRCENCKTVTILPDDLPKELREDGGFNIVNNPDNMATIQHRYPRKSPMRNIKGGASVTFLWCYKCNMEDNIKNEPRKDRY